MPRVVSGFPGVGKSHLCKLIPGVSDSDSSLFGWAVTAPDEPKKRHPDWPRNYIEHIWSLLDRPEVTYILVSSHQEVRDALVRAGIRFVLVYPALDMKREYIQRYIDRGSPATFVQLLDGTYEDWITKLTAQDGCEHRVLQSGQYLADVLEGVTTMPPKNQITFTSGEKADITTAHGLLTAAVDGKVGGSLAQNFHRALTAAKTEAHNVTEARAWVTKAWLKGFEGAEGLMARDLDGIADWWLRGILVGVGYFIRQLHLDSREEHDRLYGAARASNVALAAAEHRFLKEIAKP